MRPQHAAPLVGVGLIWVASLQAGTARLGFENAVDHVADNNGMVVRATVLRGLDGLVQDPAGSRLLYRHQRIRIDDCYFDAGGECERKVFQEITVPVAAGARREVDGRTIDTRLATGSTAVTVNTLTEGQELVLFLTPTSGGPDFYRVIPLQQGKRPIRRATDGQAQIELDLVRVDPPAQASSTPRTGRTGRSLRRGHGRRVAVDRLPTLIEQVLQRPPRRPQRRPETAPAR